MNPFEIRHRRRKGEDLRAWVVRVITTECESGIPGVKEDMIEEALAFYRGRVAEHVENEERVRAETETSHLRARLAELTRQYAELQARHTALHDSLPTSISVREAEKARLGAFRLAREKAAMLFEDRGVPTSSSEAIRDIPDPKPRWSAA